MMLFVVGGDSVSRDHDPVVALIRIDRRRSHTCVSIGPRYYDAIRFQRLEQFIKVSSEERTVTLLCDHRIPIMVIKVRENLATVCTGNRNGPVVIAHGEKGIAQVRCVLLPHPNNRPPSTAKRRNQFVYRTDQRTTLFSQRSRLKEIIENIVDQKNRIFI